MYDLFGGIAAKEEIESKKRLLENERLQINESILCLTLNSDLYKVPVYKALQILVKEAEGDSSKIEQLSEAEIVKYYQSILLVFQSAMKSPKEIIVIQSEKFSFPITNPFLDFLKEDNNFNKNGLGEWLSFSTRCSDFYIPITNIKKLLLTLKSNQNYSPQKSSQTTKSRQEFLIKTFNSLCEEDRALLFDIPQGKTGLKRKIQKRISGREFKLYFADIDHNFDNVWKAVRKKMKKEN